VCEASQKTVLCNSVSLYAGIDQLTDFIGTTDDVVIRRNNVSVG
jgi:hypothetical protein